MMKDPFRNMIWYFLNCPYCNGANSVLFHENKIKKPYFIINIECNRCDKKYGLKIKAELDEEPIVLGEQLKLRYK